MLHLCNMHIFNTFGVLWSQLGLNQRPPDYESEKGADSVQVTFE